MTDERDTERQASDPAAQVARTISSLPPPPDAAEDIRGIHGLERDVAWLKQRGHWGPAMLERALQRCRAARVDEASIAEFLRVHADPDWLRDWQSDAARMANAAS